MKRWHQKNRKKESIVRILEVGGCPSCETIHAHCSICGADLKARVPPGPAEIKCPFCSHDGYRCQRTISLDPERVCTRPSNHEGIHIHCSKKVHGLVATETERCEMQWDDEAGIRYDCIQLRGHPGPCTFSYQPIPYDERYEDD